MFVTVVAVVCHVLAGVQLCEDLVVTDTDRSGVTFIQCTGGGAQPALAQWMASRPGYRLAKWKCVPGHFIPNRES